MQRKQYAKDYKPKDASALRVGIVVSEWNSDITENMLAGARETLRTWGVKEKNVHVVHVAGSFEIPYGCLKFLKTKKIDTILALGCIIKGETDHDRYIAGAVSQGIMDLMLQYNVPISFGVLTTNNLAQAQARAQGEENKGCEAAVAALSAALL